MRLSTLASFLISLNVVAASKEGLRHHQKKASIQDDACVAQFKELDENKDGAITKKDLATVLLGQGLTNGEVKERLSGVDKRTTMDLAEFCSNTEKKEVAGLEKKKAAHKKNKQTKTLRVPSNLCREAFDYIDSSSDGWITVGEVEDNIDDRSGSYYRYYSPSDLDSVLDRYSSRRYIDYDDFEDYFCDESRSSRQSNRSSRRSFDSSMGSETEERYESRMNDMINDFYRNSRSGK